MLSMDSATYSVCGLRCVENTNQSALCEGEKKKWERARNSIVWFRCFTAFIVLKSLASCVEQSWWTVTASQNLLSWLRCGLILISRIVRINRTDQKNYSFLERVSWSLSRWGKTFISGAAGGSCCRRTMTKHPSRIVMGRWRFSNDGN